MTAFEPAAAARPAGGHAVLGARLAQPFAGVVAQLGGEGPLADPGRVRLDDPDDVGDPGRADAGPDAGPARGGGGRGDERVGAVVHVEHGRLGALEQHHLALVQRPAQGQGRVGHVGAEPLGVLLVIGRDRLGFDPAPVVDLGQDLVLLPQHQVELLPQDAGVEQVLDADPGPRDLVAVGRADAAAGRADPRAAQVPFGHLVQRPVVRRDQVRVGRDQELGAVHAAGGQAVDLVQQHLRVDHHAVADHRDDVRRQHPGRQQVQGVALVADDDRVAGVVPALVPDHVVDAVPEQVGGLALALIAPLSPDNHDGGHAVFPSASHAEAPARAQARQGALAT